jgi:hypothetical protein
MVFAYRKAFLNKSNKNKMRGESMKVEGAAQDDRPDYLVSIWYWYYQRVLQNPALVGSEGWRPNLSHIKQVWLHVPQKYYPAWTQKSDSTRERWTKALIHIHAQFYSERDELLYYVARDPSSGLKLMSRTSKSKELLKQLKGWVQPLGVKQHETLKYQYHHHSMIGANIVYGAISIANHTCGSPFNFHATKKMIEELPHSIGGSVYAIELVKPYDEYRDIRGRRVIGEGQEITVCYTPGVRPTKALWGFDCACGQCPPPKEDAKTKQVKRKAPSSPGANKKSN